MRGERPVFPRGRLADDGSSPHARGTPLLQQHVTDELRFIPACAGNAAPAPPVSRLGPVHPRMRGERTMIGADRPRIVGSSPHARGTPEGTFPTIKPKRFIPACAGNAVSLIYRLTNIAVHPRMRGERRVVNVSARVSGGSSPHARGTHVQFFSMNFNKRFIPACAGNAHWPTCSSRISAVHPRMRGERVPVVGLAGFSGGSSPHARGTRERQQPQSETLRFIPACAGNAGR